MEAALLVAGVEDAVRDGDVPSAGLRGGGGGEVVASDHHRKLAFRSAAEAVRCREDVLAGEDGPHAEVLADVLDGG